MFANFSYGLSAIHSNTPNIVGYINTNKEIYLQGEAVNVNGAIWNNSINRDVTVTSITLRVIPIDSTQKMTQSMSIHLDTSALNMGNVGKYNITLRNMGNVGKYNITSSINGNIFASTTIEVIIDIFRTAYFWLLIACVLFFAALMASISLYAWKYSGIFAPSIGQEKSKEVKGIGQNNMPGYHMHRSEKEEKKQLPDVPKEQMRFYILIDMLRFICISGIVMFFIISFFFLPSEIGTGPVSLILKHIPDRSNMSITEPFEQSPSTRQVWVLNVGGISTNNPISGLNVPVFVILGGILGGYVRYLYKAATKEDVTVTKRPERNEQHSMSPLRFAHETFEELSEIALSGLLAIIVWFIISQGSVNPNTYTLGGISLAVGLATREIVAIVKDFATKINK